MRNAEASIDPPTDPFAATSEAVSARQHPRPGQRFTASGRDIGHFRQRAPRQVASARDVVTAARQGRGLAGRGAAQGQEVTPPQPLALDDLPEDEPKVRWVRPCLLTVAIVLAVLYAVPAFLMAGTVYPGTTVLGVDVGGMTAADAARLTTGLVGLATNAVVVRDGTKTERIVPEQSGLTIDIPATVRTLPMGFPSPVDVWRAGTTGREITPVIRVDSNRLGEVISTQVARSIERPVVEGGVTFDGLRPEPVYPKEGTALDVLRVAAQVRGAYLNPDIIVDVKPRQGRPPRDARGVNRAVVWARKAVAAPVTLTHGGISLQLTQADIAEALSFEPGDNGVLQPRFDAAAATKGCGSCPRPTPPATRPSSSAAGGPSSCPDGPGSGSTPPSWARRSSPSSAGPPPGRWPCR